MVTGYRHPDYAVSLSEFGAPRELIACGGWVLERRIPATPDLDAMGCYPFFACRDWSKLAGDLEKRPASWVCVFLVADPFGDFDPRDLALGFDVFRRFKPRYVVDCRTPLGEIGSEHHRYYARKARKTLDVEVVTEPLRYLDEWVSLYDNLIARHGLRGLRAFSRNAFSIQLAIPGLVMFRAVAGEETVGLDLWYVQGDVAYGHLVAYSPLGYKMRASYALKSYLIGYFSEKVRWLDLGGASGVDGGGRDGLGQFKQGWATGTRPTYFCGRVLDRERYDAILREKRTGRTEYFPAYRRGEFESAPAGERSASKR